MAVLVLYNRSLDEAAPWPALRSWLGGSDAARLRHCLIYDNSPTAMVDAATLPANVSLVWNLDNGGTAGAYRTATARAPGHGCDWLLLLDQDSVLPHDYLQRAGQAALATPDAAVLVPRVRHDAQLVSPATITPAGSVRPTPEPARTPGMATAISSGAIVRCDAIAEIAFPPAIWLDYVDHWMFLDLARRAATIAVIDAELVHDLSVRTPETLSATRLRSILAAETTFYAAFGGKARAMLPFRRLLRAARYASAGRWSLAGIVARDTLNGMTHTA